MPRRERERRKRLRRSLSETVRHRTLHPRRWRERDPLHLLGRGKHRRRSEERWRLDEHQIILDRALRWGVLRDHGGAVCPSPFVNVPLLQLHRQLRPKGDIPLETPSTHLNVTRQHSTLLHLQHRAKRDGALLHAQLMVPLQGSITDLKLQRAISGRLGTIQDPSSRVGRLDAQGVVLDPALSCQLFDTLSLTLSS